MEDCCLIVEHAIFAAAETHIGSRSENEDSYLVLIGDKSPCGTMGLFAVADGMGGSGKGGVASAMIMQTLADVFPAACQVNQSKQVVDATHLLRFAIQKANAAIYSAASANRELKGAGAACVAATIADGNVYIASVGDSRAYLLGSGHLEQITEDEWVREGPVTLVNQAVGLQPVLFPQLTQRKVRREDVLLLVTDGLTEAVSDDRIEKIVSACTHPAKICAQLIEETLTTPNPDNVTVVTIKFREE